MLAPGNAPIRKSSVVQEIAERLKREIFAGTYTPGEALPPERDLAGHYGVTRTSIKHALVRLEELGLIETRHGVGSVVQDIRQSGGAELLKYLVFANAELDPKLFEEILEVRNVVVAGFVELAAERRSEESLVELRAMLDELRSAAGDIHSLETMELNFFRAVARAADNRAFLLVINSVSAVSQSERLPFLEPLRAHDWLVGRLESIYKAIEDARPKAARTAAERYFREGSERILEVIRSQGR